MPILPPSSNDDAQRIKGVAVDDTNKSDGKNLTYVAASQKLEYTTPPGATGGEANTASNRPGTAGAVGVFKTKAGTDLQFKKINAGSNKVTVTDDTANDEVDIDVNPANIAHSGLSGVGTNTHAQIDTHIADATKHRQINDAGSGTTDLWSASKITTSLSTKSDTGHVHSPSEITNFDEAVQDSVTGMVQNSTSITQTYNDGANTDYLDVVPNTTLQKVNVSKAGTSVGTRKQINLIEGSNVTITATDNSGSDRVDVTIAATGGGGGSTNLDGLIDVTVTSPANGQVLKYNSSTSQWVNDVDQTGGGAGATNLTFSQSSTTLTVLSDTGTDAVLPAADTTNAGVMSADDKTKLNGIASGATANSADATLLARANHTGTQSADTLTDGTTNKAFLATERTKLAGVATGATANDTDANLKARANHTGSQTASTISDFQTTVSANTDVAANTTARHTHSNKALLDTYTQTETNLADAVTKKHAATTVGTKTIDEAAIGNGKAITYNSTSGNLEYTTVSGSGMTNPMTTDGDIIYGGASGAATRLAKGAAGQVLTMNAGATAPEWAAASGGGGTSTPQLEFSSLFENSGRFSNTVSGAGAAVTYGTTGSDISSGSASAGYAKSTVRMFGGINWFTGSSELHLVSGAYLGTTQNVESYTGVGDLTVAASGITFTGKHYGWKHVRTASTTTHSYTVADGTTETAGTYTDSEANGVLYTAKKTSTTDVKFYFNGSLVGTVTTNLPTGSTQYPVCFAMSNKNSNTNTEYLQLQSFNYRKDAY